MPAGATQDEACRIAREAFLVFEHKEGSRMADEKDIPTIVRSMGINPTGVQIEKLREQLRSAQPEETTLIPLDSFEQVVSAFALSNKNELIRDDYHKLMRAFKALDPEKKGYIDADTFGSLLSSRGEALSSAETSTMLSCASEAATGRVYYEDYAYKLAINGRKV
ncbi:Dynein regulatory complex protein 8 [Trebouxia sp. C0009 RCD-2024]